MMGGAQSKVVFGGLADEDADIMAMEIMRNSFNLERPKHILDRPTVVGDEVIWLELESRGRRSCGVSRIGDGWPLGTAPRRPSGASCRGSLRSCHRLGNGEHEPGDIAEQDALARGEVGPKKAGEEVVERLDDARCYLLPGKRVVVFEPAPVHVEDVEGRRVFDVLRGYQEELRRSLKRARCETLSTDIHPIPGDFGAKIAPLAGLGNRKSCPPPV